MIKLIWFVVLGNHILNQSIICFYLAWLLVICGYLVALGYPQPSLYGSSRGLRRPLQAILWCCSLQEKERDMEDHLVCNRLLYLED